MAETCGAHLSDEVVVLSNESGDLFVEAHLLFGQHLDASVVLVDLCLQLSQVSEKIFLK